MSQPTLRYWFRTGRQLWLAVALTLGLTLGSQTAAAKECHQETPLPADVRPIAPGPEVPETVARFAGAWSGVWEDSWGLCHTLVVEEVLANGYALVIMSHGTSATLGRIPPSFFPRDGCGRSLAMGGCPAPRSPLW